ncbi:conserved hypothetical protein [Ricinus communis]|uniref:Uncharacterized protein n=1 Tax=Ricinus communis TaxID=3988 RepID=B9TCH2_RICCO|nr:conserved hypothetical protein [Ricinus communis]
MASTPALVRAAQARRAARQPAVRPLPPRLRAGMRQWRADGLAGRAGRRGHRQRPVARRRGTGAQTRRRPARRPRHRGLPAGAAGLAGRRRLRPDRHQRNGLLPRRRGTASVARALHRHAGPQRRAGVVPLAPAVPRPPAKRGRHPRRLWRQPAPAPHQPPRRSRLPAGRLVARPALGGAT